MNSFMDTVNGYIAWSGLIIGVLAIFKTFGLEAFKGIISNRIETIRTESAEELELLKAKYEYNLERFKGFHAVLAKDEIDTYKKLWTSISLSVIALNRISDDINPWTLADLYSVDRSEIEDYDCERAIELKSRYLEDTINDLKVKMSSADEIAYASRPFISEAVWSEITDLHTFLAKIWIDLKLNFYEQPLSEFLENARSEAEIKVSNISSTIKKATRE
ncbi:hypothetical protein [Pseudomonas auratipiscis]|uniref:DUF4760 domain-containing protein n=1 Tax=Pseudomonas auratipiscis TaxID=3115853 RepID=A0AB35WYJ7_9PSED|nr:MULTISPECIES: hypothetical protein [unclassified Pseudomonas]MEE1868464.1 hypothetical protein [Pseudomonas sp. 120P]MEE1960861.1 hypothetical protein [Pseudomonas sp. 119P]